MADIKQTDELPRNTSVRQLLFDNRMTLEELAADLRYSKHTIYKWLQDGMPSLKFKGRLYFDPQEVAQWIQRTTKR